MRIKKYVRRASLILLIILASMLPMFIPTFKKDKLPSHVIEQIDTKDEEDEDGDTKELF
jgi:hypothetical protein